MKKTLLSLVAIILFFSERSFSQATFKSNFGFSLSWNNAASWTLISGTDSDGIPDANDDVIINNSFSIVNVTNPQACNNLTIDGNGSALSILNVGDDLVINGNVSVTDGGGTAQMSILSGYSTTVTGNIVYYNIIDPLKAKFEVQENSILTIAGNIGSGGTFDAIPSSGTSTLILNSATSQSIPGSSANYTYKDITKNGSGTATLTGALDPTNFTGNLTINAGTFDNGGFDITANSTTLTVAGGAVLRLSGTSSFPSGFSAINLQYNSTVEYGGSTQTVAKMAYSNLNIANAGTKTLADTASVNGVLLIGSGATFDMNNQVFIVTSDGTYTGAIGEIQGTLTNATNVLIHRYANEGTGWYQLCSPVNNTTFSSWIDDFVISGPAGSDDGSAGAYKSLYYYDETLATTSNGEGYVAVSDITNSINSGANRTSGYFAWLQSENPYDNTKRNFPMIIDVQGSINTGDIIIPLTNGGNGSGVSGWHLVNNPYPSSISWDAISRGPNVKTIAYVLSAPGGSSGSWETLDATSGTDNDQIAMGEAFWVSVASADNITVQEADKNPSSTDGFHNTSAKIASGFNANEFSELKIELEDNGYRDKAWIRFNPQATENYDFIDGDKLEDIYGRPNISTMTANKDLVINYLPLHSNLSIDVPIRIWSPYPTNSDKTFKVTLSNVADLLSKNKCLSFEDTLNNVSFPLTKDTTYTFVMNDTIIDPVLFIHVNYPVSIEKANATCANDNNGQIVVTPNYAGVYDIDWYDENSILIKQSTGVTQSDTLSNIAAGTYYVMISGTGGCSSSAATPVVVYDEGEVNITAEISSPLCSNTADGSISVTPSGTGTAFSYTWNTGDNSQAINNLDAGIYSVTVTDNNGCKAEKSITITSPAPLGVNINKIDASCQDTNDGMATAIASGDNPPFTYLWSNGENASTASGLFPGTYEVTVTDANGCSSVQTINVDANVSISAMFSVPNTTVDIADGGIFMPQNQSSGAVSYQWNFGDGGTSIDANPTHIYGDTGIYVVVLNAYNGNCTDNYSETIHVIDSSVLTSVSELEDDGISIINKNEYILVKFNNIQPEKVELFNIIGQKIYEVNKPAYKVMQIQKEENTGVYILRVTAKEKVFTTKISNN